jgi:hypothetical protein
MGDHYDVVVMGLDPSLPRDEVVARLASHLDTTPDAIERFLAAAPTAIVSGVSELDARRLVTDLRQLGARVKPRAPGAALPSVPPPSSRSSASSRPPISAPSVAEPSPVASSSRPRRAAIEEIDLSTSPPAPTGLELDLPLPEPRAPSIAPRPASIAPSSLAEPSRTRPQPDAPPPKLLATEEKPERPRAFWTALPEAFVVPFRGHALYGLLGAPVLAVCAMIAGVVGTRISVLSVLVALVFAFGFVGTMLQVARRCLWATAVGDRVPDALPSDLMSEYMFTGAGVVIAQGVLVGISGWIAMQLTSHGAPSWALDVFFLFISLYGVIGFALSAANGSASGYLDVLRILRILARAPIHVLAIAVLGAIVQGGAFYAAGLQLMGAMATGDFSTMFVSLGLVGFFIAFTAAYGAALSATMMGMLFYAKPDVAN